MDVHSRMDGFSSRQTFHRPHDPERDGPLLSAPHSPYQEVEDLGPGSYEIAKAKDFILRKTPNGQMDRASRQETCLLMLPGLSQSIKHGINWNPQMIKFNPQIPFKKRNTSNPKTLHSNRFSRMDRKENHKKGVFKKRLGAPTKDQVFSEFVQLAKFKSSNWSRLHGGSY